MLRRHVVCDVCGDKTTEILFLAIVERTCYLSWSLSVGPQHSALVPLVLPFLFVVMHRQRTEVLKRNFLVWGALAWVNLVSSARTELRTWRLGSNYIPMLDSFHQTYD